MLPTNGDLADPLTNIDLCRRVVVQRIGISQLSLTVFAPAPHSISFQRTIIEQCASVPASNIHLSNGGSKPNHLYRQNAQRHSHSMSQLSITVFAPTPHRAIGAKTTGKPISHGDLHESAVIWAVVAVFRFFSLASPITTYRTARRIKGTGAGALKNASRKTLRTTGCSPKVFFVTGLGPRQNPIAAGRATGRRGPLTAPTRLYLAGGRAAVIIIGIAIVASFWVHQNAVTAL